MLLTFGYLEMWKCKLTQEARYIVCKPGSLQATLTVTPSHSGNSSRTVTTSAWARYYLIAFLSLRIENAEFKVILLTREQWDESQCRSYVTRALSIWKPSETDIFHYTFYDVFSKRERSLKSWVGKNIVCVFLRFSTHVWANKHIITIWMWKF